MLTCDSSSTIERDMAILIVKTSKVSMIFDEFIAIVCMCMCLCMCMRMRREEVREG